MRFNLPYKIILLSLFISSCENKITAPERAMNQPTGIEVSGYNQSLFVKFYGQNFEEGFQGYNVYVSRTPGIVPSSDIHPVLNGYNSIPTLMYGSMSCFPDASQESFITLYRTSGNESISNGHFYYVAVSSYALIGNKAYESGLSEEVRIFVNFVSSNQLRNQNITGVSNDGLLFTGNGAAQTVNAPDNLTNNWGGDLLFKIKSINGVLVPVLSVESNNNGLQDSGYYPDITVLGDVPPSGYVHGYYVIAQKNHLYVLMKNSSFIRIYITDIIGSMNALDSDMLLKLKYAY